jgi:hypothetical protein
VPRSVLSGCGSNDQLSSSSSVAFPFGAADAHQAAPDRPGIAFTYVTDGGLTSPGAEAISPLSRPVGQHLKEAVCTGQTEVKIQPEDHALGKNFASC